MIAPAKPKSRLPKRKAADSWYTGGIANVTESFNKIVADYNAAKTTRLTRRRAGVNAVPYTGDYHYRYESDYLRMMELARDIDRNDPVIGHAVDLLCDNVIQDGFLVDPKTPSDDVNKLLTEKWQEWATDPDRCDISQEFTFADFEYQHFRSAIVDGDFWSLGLRSGALQGIEAHRIRTPKGTTRNVVHGVLLNNVRRREQVWVTKEDIDPMAVVNLVGEMKQFDYRSKDGIKQAFQTYLGKRITQTRGVTQFAPMTDLCTMREDIDHAKLIQQQIASCFAIIRTRELGWDSTNGGADNYGESGTETVGGETRYTEEIAPGMEIFGRPGEKIEGFSPNVPNQSYFEQVRHILQIMAVNLKLPVHVLLLDPSNTNFSGWRGAIDQARKSWKRMQCRQIRQFNRPVYTWKVWQWILSDPRCAAAYEQYGDLMFRHAWNPPGWPYIEPKKDAECDVLRLSNGIVSPRKWATERGYDYQDLVSEIVADRSTLIRAAKKAAIKINGEFDDGDPVKWRELAPGISETAAAPLTASTETSNPGTNNTGDDDE